MIYIKPGVIHRLHSLRMHPQTLKSESVDASTDSESIVGGCIHILKNQDLLMHQRTLILIYRSTISCFRVGGCIKYGLSCRLSTDCQVRYVTWSTIHCRDKSIQNLTPLHFRSAQCQLTELWDFHKSVWGTLF